MKSFLHGRKTVPVSALRTPSRTLPTLGTGSTAAALARAHAAESRCSHAEARSGETTVEVVKDGEKVIRMIVTCACGERIEIDCLYAAIG